ncbi:MAG: cell division protein FtsQ/DivIB [Gammaproteobacteria bacterium]|jgi:cell division protein FtsQ
MGARRINNQRKSESRWSRWREAGYLKLAAVAVLFISVGSFVNHLYQPQTLSFETIQVFGELKWMDRKTLNRVVLENLDGGFFSLDVDRLKQQLERQTWIDSVAVRRVWPDVLQLSVSEQQPIAVWNHKVMVNERGELFGRGINVFPPDLVTLQGPSGMHNTLIKHYQTLAGMITTTGLRIAGVTVDNRRAMQLTLNNGVQLKLGRVRRDRDITTEMKRFVQAYQATLAAKIENIQLVDLRYTNGLAVRWKRDSTSGADNNNRASSAVLSAQG